MIYGRIIKGIGGFYYVDTEEGVAECRARGKMRRAKIVPAVGDNVGVTIVNKNPLEGAVEEILPRKNSLIRPPVANIDVIVIVVAATSPAPDYFMIDKLAVTAAKADIEVVIAVNKTDLDSGDGIISTYKKAGYKTVSLCATEGKGIDELKECIKGKVAAFAGNSGVGKSSILNNFGFVLETGDVSKIERGRHTTRHVELMKNNDGGFVMDTPGFSLLEISDITAPELRDLFPEFKPYNDLCRFLGCSHFNTSPDDCAVAEAAEKGEIPATRYESYSKIYDKLKELKDWEQKNED